MQTTCPVNNLIQILSKRWVMFILLSIREGKNGFNDIKRANHGMSAKILSERLIELENEGYIVRTVSGDRPIRISYNFTEKGASLQTVLFQLNEWAIDNKEIILA